MYSEEIHDGRGKSSSSGVKHCSSSIIPCVSMDATVQKASLF